MRHCEKLWLRPHEQHGRGGGGHQEPEPAPAPRLAHERGAEQRPAQVHHQAARQQPRGGGDQRRAARQVRRVRPGGGVRHRQGLRLCSHGADGGRHGGY